MIKKSVKYEKLDCYQNSEESVAKVKKSKAIQKSDNVVQEYRVDRKKFKFKVEKEIKVTANHKQDKDVGCDDSNSNIEQILVHSNLENSRRNSNIKAKEIDEDQKENIKKKHKKLIKREDTSNEEMDDSDSGVDDSDTEVVDEKKKIYTSLRKKINQEESVDSITDEYFMMLLSRAELEVSWEIPELHTLTRNLEKSMSRQRIAELNLPHRTGAFTPAEDKILERNWNEMCHKFNLPNCPEVFGQWRNSSNNKEFLKARRKALLYLGRNLEHRTLAQIYIRFKTSMGCTKKGRFTEDEKEVIELFISMKEDIKGLSQSYLASILGRDKYSIWRYIKQRNREEKHFIKWDMQSTEKFIKILLKEVNEMNGDDEDSSDVNVLHGLKVPWSVWINVAEKMNSYPLNVKVYWISKVYTQLFAKNPILLTTVREKLIKVLLEKKYVYWQDIHWNEVVKELDNNYTSLFLWRRYYMLVKGRCPQLLKSVKDSVQFLHNKFIVLGNKLNNRRLRRLKFNKHGKLVFKD